MLIILSPSKSVNFKSEKIPVNMTLPLFEKDSLEINTGLTGHSVTDIMEKERVSLKIARTTYEYIQTFKLKNTERKPAIFAFDGNVYDKLKVREFNEKELSIVQKHVRIFSAMYGILSPFDSIKPYRFDMISKLSGGLYDFWKDKVTTEVIRLLKKDDGILVNLASSEYSKMIDFKKLPKNCRIITPVFQQEKEGKYVTKSLYAKYARGLMTRFIVENNITDPEYLKGFDSEGYYFNPYLSKKDEWYFTR